MHFDPVLSIIFDLVLNIIVNPVLSNIVDPVLWIIFNNYIFSLICSPRQIQFTANQVHLNSGRPS